MTPLAREYATPIVLAATILVGSPAFGATLFEDHFDKPTESLAGGNGWSRKYCADNWRVSSSGRAMAKNDDGCACNQGCDFGVYTQGSNVCIKSEPVDNIVVNGSSDWKDYVFETRMRNLDDDTMGVVFRYKNTANYYAVWFSHHTAPSPEQSCDGGFKGARLVSIAAAQGAGKATVVANSPVTYEQGKEHLIRVRVAGSSIQVYFDVNADGVIAGPDEFLFNALDTTHSAGGIGLFAYQNGSSTSPCNEGGCGFDDVVVRTLDDEGGGKKDGDGDAIADGADNCPTVANADQANKDGDAQGDACDADADNDGLSNVDEAKFGSNALDADSDDDGLRDGLEPEPGADSDSDGLPNVRDPDSDGDGLPDGLEVGLSAANSDTDLGKGWFKADVEPSSTTNPLAADSDGDGLADGFEDTNGNGRVDPCEADPNKADVMPCVGGGGGDVSVVADGAGGGGQDAGSSGDGGAGQGDDVATSGDGLSADDSTRKGAPLKLVVYGDDSGGCSAAHGPAPGAAHSGAMLCILAGLALALRRLRGPA